MITEIEDRLLELEGDVKWLKEGYIDSGKVIHILTEEIQELREKLSNFGYPLLADVRELQNRIEMYKECFEKFIPSDKWDEARLFLSTYGSGLAKEMAKKER